MGDCAFGGGFASSLSCTEMIVLQFEGLHERMKNKRYG